MKISKINIVISVLVLALTATSHPVESGALENATIETAVDIPQIWEPSDILNEENEIEKRMLQPKRVKPKKTTRDLEEIEENEIEKRMIQPKRVKPKKTQN